MRVLKDKKDSLLTPIRRVFKEGQTSAFFEYQCECGNKTIQKRANVNSRRVVSCGCYKKFLDKNRNIFKRGSNNYNMVAPIFIDDNLFIPIYNFKGYYVSFDGVVIDYKFREIKQQILKKGYLTVSLINNQGKRKVKGVHRLMGETLLINPKSKDQIHHLDHHTSNNNLSNLMWVTNQENIDYRKEYNIPIKREYATYKVPRFVVKQIFMDNRTANKIAEDHNLNIQQVQNIKRRATRKVITEGLERGKTIYERKKKTDGKFNKYFNLWLEYAHSDKSTAQLDREHHISKGSHVNYFKQLNLPVKNNHGAFEIYLTKSAEYFKNMRYYHIWLNEYLKTDKTLTQVCNEQGLNRTQTMKILKKLNLPTKHQCGYFQMKLKSR